MYLIDRIYKLYTVNSTEEKVNNIDYINPNSNT